MPAARLRSLLLVVALLAAACGGAAPSSGAVSSPAGGGDPGTTERPSEASPATGEPAASEAPGATTEPEPEATTEPEPEPEATDEPDPEPTGEPGSEATAEPTRAPSTAEACTGSDDNRAFFAAIAKAVDWPVLCGVLPKGWFVGDGRYRKANGGWLWITYKGPGGAQLRLDQGASCAVNGGCDLGGTELGPAALGPLEGSIREVGGEFVVVVAPGEMPTWHLRASGLDQATTEALAAALAEVGD